MNKQTLTITFLSVAAFTVGCNQKETPSQQMDKIQTETKQAADDLKDYTFAQKSQFVERMRSEMTALDKDLDKLSAKIEAANDASKAEAKPKLQALREQEAQLKKQLDEAKGANESTWDSVKAGSRKAYDSLKDSFQQARQWVSDKIAP